mgnify:CR=1 FL=1
MIWEKNLISLQDALLKEGQAANELRKLLIDQKDDAIKYVRENRTKYFNKMTEFSNNWLHKFLYYNIITLCIIIFIKNSFAQI